MIAPLEVNARRSCVTLNLNVRGYYVKGVDLLSKSASEMHTFLNLIVMSLAEGNLLFSLLKFELPYSYLRTTVVFHLRAVSHFLVKGLVLLSLVPLNNFPTTSSAPRIVQSKYHCLSLFTVGMSTDTTDNIDSSTAGGGGSRMGKHVPLFFGEYNVWGAN